MALFALLALGGALPEASAADVDLKALFLSPPPSTGPWQKLKFTGGDIDERDVRARLQVLKDSGFSGLVMRFIVPGFGPRPAEEWARVNSYGTPGFFDKFAGMLASARELGLAVNADLGSCIPPGGGYAITPELAAVELTFSRQEVHGGAVDPVLVIPAQPGRNGSFLRTLRPTPPGQELPADWPARLEARARIVAVLAVRGGAPDVVPMNRALFGFPDGWGTVLQPGELLPATTVDLTGRLAADGRLAWTAPPGTWQVFVFRQVPSDVVLSCGASDGPQLPANPFDRRAFDAHAAHVFETGYAKLQPYFGNTLRGYFVDSGEFESDIYWTDDFPAQFRRRRGYDLTPYLPFVFQPGWLMHPYQSRFSAPMFDAGDVGERVRSDYRLTVSELMTEDFYEPFAALMASHGLTSRIESYGAPVDTLKVSGLATIPETEDLHVNVDPYFLRLGRAAADIYGRQLVSCESLIWGEGGPSITPLQMKDHADLLMLAGVNAMRIDGYGYNIPVTLKASGPPSPVARLGAWISPTQSTWPFIRTLATYIHRNQAVLQQGRSVVSVAVFRPDPTYVPSSGTDEPKTEPVPAFVTALPALGYDYDQISDDGLGRSRVVGHRLVTPGGASFNALVVPETASLRLGASSALRRFAQAGLPIVFAGKVPDRYAGLADHVARDAEVRADVAAALRSGARVVGAYGVAEGLAALHVAPNLAFLGGLWAPFIERAVGSQRAYFFRNPDDAERVVAFRTGHPGSVELLDAWSGNAQSLPSFSDAGADVVAFALPPHETRLVVVDASKPRAAGGAVAPAFAVAQAARPSPALEIGAAGWSLHASGRGAGGRPVSEDLQLKSLADWTTLPALRDLAGEGFYATTFDVPGDWLRPGRRYWIELGDANDASAVDLNGRRFEAPLALPHKVDVTAAIRPGPNELRVSVLSTPNNSAAATSPGLYGIRPAGLVGPVWLKIGPQATEAAPLAPPPSPAH